MPWSTPRDNPSPSQTQGIRRQSSADAANIARQARSRDRAQAFLPEATYTNTEVAPFRLHDRLLLYSDGVSEARDRAGHFFDRDRVAAWLSDIEQTSAERFVETALGELTHWTGGGFDDDVTFVIVESAR